MRDLSARLESDIGLGINAGSVDLIVAGIPRSGTTLVYRIACDTFGIERVVKTHEWIDAPGIPSVMVCRDLRDCVVSNWRYRHSEEVKNFGKMPLSRIVYIARRTAGNALITSHYRSNRLNSLLRYEEFIGEPLKILEAIELVSDTEVKTAEKYAITSWQSIDRNRSIAENRPDNLMQQGHVHDGTVGSWRDFVDDDGAKLLNEILARHNEELGYMASEPNDTRLSFRRMLSLRDMYGLITFVETGTGGGDTAVIASNCFYYVATCERTFEQWQDSQSNVRKKANIFSHFGDSVDFLRNISNKLRSPALYYLDAHWDSSGNPDEISPDVECPLMEELTTIKAACTGGRVDVIVIDDARLFINPPPPPHDPAKWPTINDIMSMIESWPVEMNIKVEYDQITITPASKAR